MGVIRIFRRTPPSNRQRHSPCRQESRRPGRRGFGRGHRLQHGRPACREGRGQCPAIAPAAAGKRQRSWASMASSLARCMRWVHEQPPRVNHLDVSLQVRHGQLDCRRAGAGIWASFFAAAPPAAAAQSLDRDGLNNDRTESILQPDVNFPAREWRRRRRPALTPSNARLRL